MKFRNGWMCLALAALAAFAGTAQAMEPQWTQALPGKVKWHRLTDLGLLLVGTDDALLCLDGDGGKILWQRDDLRQTLPYNVREIEGTSILVVNNFSGAIGSKVTATGIDMGTGADVFRTEPENGHSIGLYPHAAGNIAVGFAQIFGDSGIQMTGYEIPGGKQLWRTKYSGTFGGPPLYPDERGAIFTVQMDLSGHQNPLFDGGVMYVPFNGLMAVDLATGAIKWNVEFDSADKKLKKAYAAPVIEGDTIYASAKGAVVYAIDRNSGAVKWKSDSVFSGRVAQILVTGDTLYARLGGNFYNTEKKAFTLDTPLGVAALDKTTGAKRWVYKGADDGITNLAYDAGRNAVVFADGHRVVGLDAASTGKASEKFAVPIEFKRKLSGGEMAARGVGALSGLMSGGLAGAIKGASGGESRLDVPVALMPRQNGALIVAGRQHLLMFDPAQTQILWSTSYPAPANSGIALTAMSALTLVAAAGSMYNVAAGGSTYAANTMNNTNYGNLANMASKRYTASKQLREWAYVLTNVEDGRDSGPGLLAISLATGEPGRQVLLDDKEPEYEVDEVEGRLFHFEDKKRVSAYLMK